MSAAHYGHAGAKRGESHFEVDIEATAFSETDTISSIDLWGIKALVRYFSTCCSFEC